jgi:hypothetical protein
MNSGAIHRRAVLIALTILVSAGGALSQEWSRVEIFDPQQDRPFTEFTLPGKFIETRHAADNAFPLLIVRCQPGLHDSGRLHGKLLAAAVHIGRVQDGVHLRTEAHEELFSAKPDVDSFYVEYAYDDGEPLSDHWDNVMDFRAAGFGRKELNGILWGTTELHQEGSTPPVKKLVLTLQPPVAGKIVMRFDMPDPSVVSEECGCTYFKKKK